MNLYLDMNKTKSVPVMIASLQNILRLVRQQQMLPTIPYQLYLTNKYSETLLHYHKSIESIQKLNNITFIPNYKSALSMLSPKSSQQLTLLVGDPHHHLHQQIKGINVITLEQLCSIYPEKVPLSYRSRDIQKTRKKLEKRLNLVLEEQPKITHVLVTSHHIKMWDEAIQVIFDLHPASMIIQYEQKKPKGQFYRLGLEDFISAYKTCHNLILSNISKPTQINTMASITITDFNKQNLHLKWIIQKYQLKVNMEAEDDTFFVDQDLITDNSGGFKKINIDQIVF